MLSRSMAKEGSLPTSTLETDTAGIEENQSRSSTRLCDGDPNMANTILVADGVEAQQGATLSLQLEEEFLSNRMAVIRMYQEKEWMDEATSKFLAQAIRKSTNDAYNRHWKNWANWCFSENPKRNPTEYDPHLVLRYLVSIQTYSSQHLNVVRSALASVFRIIHSNKPDIAEQRLIQQFFQARKRIKNKLPNISEEIFDINPLLQMVNDWGSTENLSLDQLQRNILVLLAIATMWRPRSDLGSLQYRDVSFVELNDQLLGVTLIVRTPKEIKPKASKLGLGEYQNLCSVRTLKAFVQRTKDFRISLEEEHILFLAYLGNGRTSAKSIQPKTASRWLEGTMQDSGINTNKYKAHSLRSAASTKAVSLGVPIEQIKLHANWSLTSNTFEDYYYRPRNQHKRGSDIVNTVFGEVTKNITTSEVGVEATAIVVGTTHNGYVAETKTKDVVAPLPWYRRLF